MNKSDTILRKLYTNGICPTSEEYKNALSSFSENIKEFKTKLKSYDPSLQMELIKILDENSLLNLFVCEENFISGFNLAVFLQNESAKGLDNSSLREMLKILIDKNCI